MATKFPGPYVNDCKVDETLMHYVPFANSEIGARPSGMPGKITNGMDITHVGANGRGGKS